MSVLHFYFVLLKVWCMPAPYYHSSWIDRYIAETNAKRAKESKEWSERQAQKDALEEKKFYEKHKDDWLTMRKLTRYDRTIGCDKTLHQYETPPHRNRPNAKRQPIKVQNYREMHNISDTFVLEGHTLEISNFSYHQSVNGKSIIRILHLQFKNCKKQQRNGRAKGSNSLHG